MERESVTVYPDREQTRICLLCCTVLDRLAYRLLLKHDLGRETTVDSDFAPTSVWAAMRSKPHLALVNADSPFSAAIDAVQMIVRLHPATRILVLGAALDPIHLEPWSRCRIHGYVVKDGGVEELRQAITAVLDKRQYYSEGIRAVVCRDRNSGADGEPKVRLSRRESELLPLLARGLTLREAAQKLTVSYKTADSYRTSLLRKLGLHDRVELARYAIRERIVEP